MNAKHILLILLWGYFPGSALALMNLSQNPLFIASTEPRVMLVASRDHQLSMKAYTDYSDIDANGSLDTTYNDGINYYGYFDSNKCYTYTSSRFEPASTAAGLASPLNHQCSGQWSGNFLNWASMTRMDVLRKTFYGGYRSIDTTGASAETVLERHFLPVDVHAFVKVYNPGSAATLSLYMPSSVVGTNTSISLCNVSDSTNTNLTGTSSFTMPAPLIKVAGDRWPQWDSSEVTQCAVNIGNSTQPTALLGTYNARVKVCASTGGVETNCKTYTHPTTGVQTVKPVGLLQQYGDVDAERPVRFGLMTGSYAANKSGGVLRKNVGLITNNNKTSLTSSSVCGGNNDPNDEIDVCTGQFINQASTQAGIINTLNRLHIAGFQYTSTGRNGSHRYSCNSPGILSFTDGQCVDWGNPLAETYLESLRYFANAGATTAFNVSDASILSSIPQVSWTDPLPATEWCALSSIIVLSTGLNSFDTDQLASFTPSGGAAINAATLTQTVGDSSHENINGGSYLIGGNGSTANNQCTSKTISNLATAKGICPEVPSTEGGYGIAGLAYAPKTIDLRPGTYATQRNARWGDNPNTAAYDPINADWALRQPINTYAVQLGETLPSFSTAVGTGTVTLLPACQANSLGNPGVWTAGSSGWRNCSMTNLVVNDNVAMASVGSDTTAKTNTCSGNGTTSRCFSVAWEDSTWGNDYDMDGIQRLGYCVGSACSSFKMLCPTTSSAYATIGPWTVTSSQIVIASCVTQTQAGHSLTFGYTLTGTTNDGAFFPVLRPGSGCSPSCNFNVGSALPTVVTAPSASVTVVSSGGTPTTTAAFSQGSSTSQLLKNPLWYAAKYGSFTDSTPTVGTPRPDLTSEWDAINNVTGLAGADGDPDNYFNVRNPANLFTALSNVFDRAAAPDASAASVATNSTNLKINSRIFQAKFSSADWSGQVISYIINTSPSISFTAEWDAGSIINSQDPINSGDPGDRVILTKDATDGVAFNFTNLTGPTATPGTQQNFLDKDATGVTVDNCGQERVDYLRGDATREGANATFSCASTSIINKFRKRNTSKLGDVINSSPTYVGAPSAGYSNTNHSGYSAFQSLKQNRTPVVYIGGNDGMLHGFDASLDFSSNSAGVPTATSGKELVAYIPTNVYPNLSRLTAQNYNKNHHYFVDGSPMTGDADLDSSNASGTSTYVDWHTVLVGAMGAGGKGYYALDISDPATFSESGTGPADTVLWEFDETDMGYVFNMPPINATTKQAKQIVKMANGKWAVIVGNGYNSSLGKAVLYILFIEDGMDGTWTVINDYVKIEADAPVGLNNGLSTPVPFDTNNDGYADTVYAGDIKGNMWKFLVGPNTSDASVTSTTSTWKVAFSGAALFTATQPIIWPPEVTRHPNGGQLILFGTGKYIEPLDNTSTSSQTFYGIWDKHDVARTKLGTRAAELLEQTVTNAVTAAGGDYQIISANPINWRPAAGGSAADCTGSCTPTHMGWYIDLPTSGERATGIPQLISSVIFFNTFIPSTAPCEAGGSGQFMALDYLTGGMLTHPIFDTNGNGSFDSGDIIVGSFKIGAALGGTTIILDASTGLGISSLTSGKLVPTLINLPVPIGRRLSWRELVQ